MTIEELFSFLREDLKNSPGGLFVDKALEPIRKQMESRPRFRADKFKNWYISRQVLTKNSPLAFIIKCGTEDLQKGKFDDDELQITKKKRVIVAMERWEPEFKKRGIEINPESQTMLRLNTYLQYILDNELMSINDLRKWTYDALSYIANNGNEFDTFNDILKRSRTIKQLHLPYETLEKEITEEIKESKELCEKLGLK